MERFRIPVPYRGAQLLNQPIHNKGSGFTAEERRVLGLDGLLRAAVNTLDQQAARVYENLARKGDALEKYIGLASLVTGVPMARARVVIVGAGAAGIGMARQTRGALAAARVHGDDLTRALALVDLPALLARDGQPLESSDELTTPLEIEPAP
jgi:Malic enzyme, NAD binding domain